MPRPNSFSKKQEQKNLYLKEIISQKKNFTSDTPRGAQFVKILEGSGNVIQYH